MMLQNYKYQYNVRPCSKLEVYCRIEGLDPLYILSTTKKEKNREKTKNAVKALRSLFDMLMEHMKIFGLSNPYH